MLLKPISSQTDSNPLELLASCTITEPILASTYLTLKWPGWSSFDIPELVFACAVKEIWLDKTSFQNSYPERTKVLLGENLKL